MNRLTSKRARGADPMSGRNHPLMWGCHPYAESVLTVEMTNKWYELHLVFRDRVEMVCFSELETFAARRGVSPFCDHAPNPDCVRDLCEANGWTLDPLAEELIEGRWLLEYVRC